MVENRCPECDEDFASTWQVAIGTDGGYTPVFGGPVVLEGGRCDTCNRSYEPTDGGPWRRQEAG